MIFFLKITIIYQIWNPVVFLFALNRGLPCLLSIIAVGHEESMRVVAEIFPV